MFSQQPILLDIFEIKNHRLSGIKQKSPSSGNKVDQLIKSLVGVQQHLTFTFIAMVALAVLILDNKKTQPPVGSLVGKHPPGCAQV